MDKFLSFVLLLSVFMSCLQMTKIRGYAGTLALSSLLVSTPLMGWEDASIDFNISSQRADLALTRFAEQVGLTLVFPYDRVREKEANHLVGKYTLEDAIEVLLKDSGLRASFSDQYVLNIIVDKNKEEEMNKNKKFLASVVGFLVGMGGTQITSAQPVGGSESTYQDQSRALEEIVVTASRRSESLQNIATSITALSESALTQRGITNFQDIQRAAAGLHLESPANANTSSIRIRGVGTAGATNTDPSVGVVVDGVFQTIPGLAFTELMDIDRIEVLRGPQGTLFGRNTTAGVVQILTRNPTLNELSGKLQGVMGNYDAAEARGTVNIPIIDNKLAIRISGNQVNRDGYTRNVFLDEDTRNQDRYGGRFKLLWNASDDLELLWSSEYQNTKQRVDTASVTYGNDNVTVGLPMSGRPWSEFAESLGKELPPIGLGRAADSVLGRAEDTVERHILTINWSLPEHSLRSVSAYENMDTFLFLDRDGTALDLSTLMTDGSRQVLTQELILSSEKEGSLSYLVGVNYQEILKGVTDVTLADGADLIALRGGLQLPPMFIENYSDTASLGGFASLTYEFTDQWSASGGVRYTEDTKDLKQVMHLPGFAEITTLDDKKTFREWSYSTKIQYRFNPQKMVYLAYDRGYKAGGINAQSVPCLLTGGFMGCLSDNQLLYDSETTDNFEVGVKTEWMDGRVRFNGALFYQTYDDFQVPEYLAEQAFVLINNAAKVESKGLEFDITAALTNHLTLDASVALVSSKYDSFSNAPCSEPSQAGCMNGLLDLSGQRLDNAPKTTANLGFGYQAPLRNLDTWEWFARADASYRSAAHMEISLNDGAQQGGYVLYSAQLGLESTDGKWRASLWGKNLGDKVYAQMGDVSVAGITQFRGLPRTYGLTVDWSF